MGSVQSSSLRARAIAVLGVFALLAAWAAFLPAAAAVARDESAETPSDVAALEDQFTAIAERVAPTVVAISATDANIDSESTLQSDDINPDKLSDVLNNVDRIVGTGFIVDPEGYIVTNDHVIAKAKRLWVTTDDRKVYPAIVIGSDPRADLAVLKIPAKDLPAAQFAQHPARRGQWTIALGNPYGLASAGEMSMSVGVISAVHRSLPKLAVKEDRLYTDLIQTTAHINPGNSGGPLFDLHGRIIGINTAVVLPQKTTNGIGFAIPADDRVAAIINKLKQGDEIVYGFLGVNTATPTARERKRAGVKDEAGAIIQSIDAESPAAAARLKQGDVITILGGKIIRDGDHFVEVVGAAAVGQPVRAKVYRDGKSRSVRLKLRARDLPTIAVSRQTQRMRWRGLVIGPIPEHWNRDSAAGLLVIAVSADSPFNNEVASGSIITAVAGKPVASIQQLQNVINDGPPQHCRLDLAGPQQAVVSINE